MVFKRDLACFEGLRPVYEKPYTGAGGVETLMDSPFPRDSPPRSNQSLPERIKEKMAGADFVAVGVNLVVGALLIGGVIGAFSMKDPGTPPTDLSAAAFVAANESAENTTGPSPEAADEKPASERDDEDDERAPSDK